MLVNICVTFSLLLLSLPENLCQINGCLHETFNDASSSSISSTCTSFNIVSPWSFDTYDNINVEIPKTASSNGFIMAYEEGQHCISNNNVLSAVDGSEIQLSYFARGVAIIVFMFTNVIDRSIIDSVFVPIIYDDWSTYSFPLEAGEFSFVILGGVNNESSLIIIDSVTYVDEGKNLHYCMYGVPAPEPDNTPTSEPITESTIQATTEITGTTPTITPELISEPPPEVTIETIIIPEARDEGGPESRTLALALSVTFSILFAMVAGITCHCIQLRKERKRV